MKYKEQLVHENWLSKRNDIVKRDSLICNFCKNEEVIRQSMRGGFSNIKLLDNELLSFLNQGDSRLDRRRYKQKYVIRFNDETFHGQNSIVYMNGWKFVRELLSIQNLVIYYSLNKKIDEIIENDKNQFVIDAIISKNLEQITWHFTANLHVHHQYYQDEKLAWEYPDSALITLCSVCHEKLHQSLTVPHLDRFGSDIGTLTRCRKCCGEGYLPQYWYRDNGICYRCWGECYEEYITNTLNL